MNVKPIANVISYMKNDSNARIQNEALLCTLGGPQAHKNNKTKD